MPYWITSTLAATPAFAWIFGGLGVLWALLVLPRKDWRNYPLVLCVAFTLGPALLTGWMFILGTIGGALEQPLLRFDLIFGGTLVLALIGAAIVWRRHSINPSPLAGRGEGEGLSLAVDEKLLIVLIIAAFVLQWLSAAYWPFTAYDTLWVYGYEGRLYTILGYIPTHIAYYPQFVPLQYAYGQLAVGGAGFLDDHAARAVLPFLHVGSILAVYALGSRLFTRRTGIIAAALWALYPHVGEWSRFGDLEIPLAFLFTAASAFFLMAWTGQEQRRRYAAIAGMLFGIAMWTKPTAGAFAWGVALLVGFELVRLRFEWRAWRPKFELALITALAALPLGAVWYVRNLLLGHNPIDFPPGYWLTQAQRSGAEFGWPLLALLVLLAYLYLAPHATRPNLVRVLIGLALVLAGLLPSIIEPHRMGLIEWLALAAGSGLLALTLWNYWHTSVRATHASPVPTNTYALLLALPYFVTWFYSYSYHYRLSFAIVPLLLLPTAVILAHWFTRERIAALKLPLRLAYLVAIALIGIPGVVSTLNDVYAGTDWLWSGELPDDFQRYNSGNRALMNVVGGIQTFQRERDTPPVIVAPAEQRLPFFFPLMDIRTDDVPTDLDELEGVTYFIYSSQSGGAYEQIPLAQSQVFASLGRGADVMRHAWDTQDIPDGNFYYEVYEPHPERRFVEPQPIGRPEGEVLFGDFARFVGYDLGGLEFWPARRVGMKLMWQVLDTPTVDYSIFVHLMRGDELVKSWDGPPAASDHGYYTTLVWEPGEYVTDERTLRFTEDETLPPAGDDYHLVIGMYDLQTLERLPITVNGETVDSYVLPHAISILPAEPDSD